LGDGDPEFMSNLNCAKYIEQAFAGTSVAVEVETDVQKLEKEYPLLHAVARASLKGNRNQLMCPTS
jgi:leucyl aminopeptidase